MLQKFLKNPNVIGSIIPSSKYLASSFVKSAEILPSHKIVELGPGTGVMTKYILQKCSPQNLLLLEIDKDYASKLQNMYIDTKVINDDAKNIKVHINQNGWSDVNTVFSGIPFTVLDYNKTEEIIRNTYDSLEKNGLFISFLYAANPNRKKVKFFEEKLKEIFKGIQSQELIIRNVPPATIYVAKK
jgi:phospholipid N-methyltransferase